MTIDGPSAADAVPPDASAMTAVTATTVHTDQRFIVPPLYARICVLRRSDCEAARRSGQTGVPRPLPPGGLCSRLSCACRGTRTGEKLAPSDDDRNTDHMLKGGWLLLLLVAATAAASVAASAGAHNDPCHAARTCPSDDHSYVWSGMSCTSIEAKRLPEDQLPVEWGGVHYWCHVVTDTGMGGG